jgi:protein disulfide-isomerase A1
MRYLLSGDVTEKSVKQFLGDLEAGKLEPYLRSEAEPEDNSGPVKVIVGSTFDAQVRNAGHWVFLEAYAPWCGHCKKLSPIWDDLGLAFGESEGKSKVVIAKVDATANDLPKAIDVKVRESE